MNNEGCRKVYHCWLNFVVPGCSIICFGLDRLSHDWLSHVDRLLVHHAWLLHHRLLHHAWLLHHRLLHHAWLLHHRLLHHSGLIHHARRLHHRPICLLLLIRININHLHRHILILRRILSHRGILNINWNNAVCGLFSLTVSAYAEANTDEAAGNTNKPA